jgi:hypothetical protein
LRVSFNFSLYSSAFSTSLLYLPPLSKISLFSSLFFCYSSSLSFSLLFQLPSIPLCLSTSLTLPHLILFLPLFSSYLSSLSSQLQPHLSSHLSFNLPPHLSSLPSSSGVLECTWAVTACLHRFCSNCLHKSLRMQLGECLLYSTVLYSTAQYCTEQNSTAQYCAEQ